MLVVLGWRGMELLDGVEGGVVREERRTRRVSAMKGFYGMFLSLERR